MKGSFSSHYLQGAIPTDVFHDPHMTAEMTERSFHTSKKTF